MNQRWMRAAWVLALVCAASVASQSPGQLPPVSSKVPKVGERAPDFTLPGTTKNNVKLSKLLREGPKGSWVLLIFYRGHW